MPTERDILRLLRDIRGHLDGNVSLTAMAARAGWSPFHFHRAFRRVTGETPKQHTQRLRLEHAATAGPCVGLFHMPVDHLRRITMPSLSMERRELPAQPIPFVRLRTARHELSGALAKGVGKVYMHALQPRAPRSGGAHGAGGRAHGRDLRIR